MGSGRKVQLSLSFAQKKLQLKNNSSEREIEAKCNMYSLM
jgi:hypothetical protein